MIVEAVSGPTAATPWDLFLSSFWPITLAGLTGTIPLALISFALGLLIALGIALMRLSRSRVLSNLARFYVSVIRGTPLLVQLFVIFYGLPSIGIVLDPWPSAIIAFSLNVGGYAAEIIRAAVLSVPQGQWEAAYTIGMPRRTALARIILPQAARVSVPPLSNTFISLVKDTSLASLILVTELFRRAQEIAAFTLEFMVIYLEAALIYWLFCLALSALQGVLERRLDRYVVH
ncbi:amino acid ABC transporter permease [Microbacterium sp. AZCO]|uniref:amino acid ABC transporter permease n=1 Tax=Microbacterium sp. AZCO TaxID=3142976 RepID=UPI0031F43573